MRQFFRRRARKVLRDHLIRPIVQFASIEASSGVLLMLCAIAALIWANSPAAPAYFQVWQTNITIAFGDFRLSESAAHWINDGLMAVFFFLVGLEIKREVLVGELASVRRAALPVAAAIGGMIVPAGIYLVFNLGGPAQSGWGIPMATDIAFALGVLALAGPRVPVSLKVFLTALAIVDDLGAVLVIALFYTEQIQFGALAAGMGLLALAAILNNLSVRSPIPYVLIGIVTWVFFHASGVHATIAGVLLAMTIPTRVHLNSREFLNRSRELLDKLEKSGEPGEHVLISEEAQTTVYAIESACEEVQMPLERIENALHPWVVYGIVPLFAFANAGVALSEGFSAAAGSPLAYGIFFGLLVGKPLGIFLFSWLAVRAGLAVLPYRVGWGHVAGAGVLGGVGFTMSLFIAELAFAEEAMLQVSKVAILSGSVLAGILGLLLVRSQRTRIAKPVATSDTGRVA